MLNLQKHNSALHALYAATTYSVERDQYLIQVTVSTSKCNLVNIVYPLGSVKTHITFMVGDQISVAIVTAAYRWSKNLYRGEVVAVECFK